MYFSGESLYYIKGRSKGASKPKVVCGSEEANEVFVDFHASSTGAHTGQKKTWDAIRKRFFWPGMAQDIEKWVSTVGFATNLLLPVYFHNN